MTADQWDLAAAASDREVRLPSVRSALDPVRVTIGRQPFLGGETPTRLTWGHDIERARVYAKRTSYGTAEKSWPADCPP